MNSNDPLSGLIDALRQGTANQTIEWQQADSRGGAFIARRPSGTVTLRGRSSGSAIGLGTPASVSLIVKDAAGKTVEQYDAVEPMLGLGGIVSVIASQTPPDAALIALYSEVREQITKANSTMRTLAEEFRVRE